MLWSSNKEGGITGKKAFRESSQIDSAMIDIQALQEGIGHKDEQFKHSSNYRKNKVKSRRYGLTWYKYRIILYSLNIAAHRYLKFIKKTFPSLLNKEKPFLI